MTTNVLSGEVSNTIIVAVFKTKQEAEHCAQEIQEKGCDPNQFDIIAPTEKHYGRKLEPEDEGIKRTGIRSHAILGVAGLLFGAVLWGVLYYLDFAIIKSALVSSLIAFMFFGGSGGLMLGGFLMMRVDHQVVIQKVKTAKKKGQWSLVMHPRSSEEAKIITQTLSDLGVESTRSL